MEPSLLPHVSDGKRGGKQMRLDIPACPLVAVITTVVIVNNGGDNARCFVPALSRLFVVFSFLCLPPRQPPPPPLSLLLLLSPLPPPLKPNRFCWQTCRRRRCRSRREACFSH